MPERGWAGADDDVLLQHAAPHFDIVVTVNKDLPGFLPAVPQAGRLRVIVLRTHKNRSKELLPLMPAVLQALAAWPLSARVHEIGPLAGHR